MKFTHTNGNGATEINIPILTPSASSTDNNATEINMPMSVPNSSTTVLSKFPSIPSVSPQL